VSSSRSQLPDRGARARADAAVKAVAADLSHRAYCGLMHDNSSLDELVRSTQRGDEAALDEVLLRIRPVVQPRCARFFPHHAHVEDATQNTLTIIGSKISSYGRRSSFVGWGHSGDLQLDPGRYRSLRDRADRLSPVDIVPDAPDPRTTSVVAGTRLDLTDAVNELERQHRPGGVVRPPRPRPAELLRDRRDAPGLRLQRLDLGQLGRCDIGPIAGVDLGVDLGVDHAPAHRLPTQPSWFATAHAAAVTDG
jgi:DNA-directed RNA polymerase specialized sigma24 family protein